MKVLVTGAEGFVGPYLMRALERAGHEVCGTSLDGAVGHRLDLLEEGSVQQVIDELEPDALAHLAAVSAVPAAAKNPQLTWRVNVDGVRSLTSALAAARPDARILFVSSGAVYGSTSGNRPIEEHHATDPGNSYAWSKVAAEAWLKLQILSDRKPAWPRTMIARPFNHIGPGQGPEFALSGFARQIAEGEKTLVESKRSAPISISTGNLEARRDFLDVRDVVSAYVSLLESPTASGVFNICSGESHRVGDLLDRLCALTPHETTVVTSQDRMRACDRDGVLASSARLRQETDWTPTHELSDTLEQILDDWRQRVGSPVGAD